MSNTPAARAGRHQEETDVESRGRLEIAEKVVEKIASRAAGELDAVGGSTGGFLGIGNHPELSARPKVNVKLSGQVATIEVTVGVRYPVPLRRTGEELRQRVRSRVTNLTGIDVRQVDVEISWLLPDDAASRTRRLE
ncbi:Asp23/Gls24 family envelope stress response protein [Arthrobacter sp. H14]|uniref:Asp23/Gls24 family envelope stress response protein n=1 Tax=Arthrobacter sp. H14 TaxID=1312959 RepID=UPI0004AD79A7|nr:Asp23/Gls24 family envelope stress response protein [Arthrobacter sp. H14]